MKPLDDTYRDTIKSDGLNMIPAAQTMILEAKRLTANATRANGLTAPESR
jgi:hypothetical protein